MSRRDLNHWHSSQVPVWKLHAPKSVQNPLFGRRFGYGLWPVLWVTRASGIMMSFNCVWLANYTFIGILQDTSWSAVLHREKPFSMFGPTDWVLFLNTRLIDIFHFPELSPFNHSQYASGPRRRHGSDIQYSGPWFAAQNTQLNTGTNGPPFENTLHGVNLNASFSYSFSGMSRCFVCFIALPLVYGGFAGSQIIVLGTSITSNASGTQDPTWECFIENISIGWGISAGSGTENNWDLWPK